MSDLARVSAREREYVHQVLASDFGSSTGSLMTFRLERAFAELVDAEFAVAFVNGTATLHAALVAMGVGPGDEVIVPPLTMASTTLAVLQAGAVPVFADVDRDTLVIDPASVAERLTPWTKAVMPVALYGMPPDLDALTRLAREHELGIIEDDAQAFLAKINGRPIGAIGDLGSFSFQSSKHLTSGEGGIITTNDGHLATAVRRFNSLGYAAVAAAKGAISRDAIQDPGYSRHVSFGFNYRMPELCAAVALAQVERADELVTRRVEVAQLFLEQIRGYDWLSAQGSRSGATNTYWSVVLRIDHPRVTWHDFRKTFLQQGGDPFYGAWKLTYLEPLFEHGCPVRHPVYEGAYQQYAPGLCPVAEEIHHRLIQLKTNYWRWEEAERQAEALARTVALIDQEFA
jgi:perosamine synthetase